MRKSTKQKMRKVGTSLTKEFAIIAQELQRIRLRMATRDDLQNFATRDDLKNFATKVDLKNFATKEDLDIFATKNDLAGAETRIRDDLGMKIIAIESRLDSEMATKEDLEMLLAQIVDAIDKSIVSKEEFNQLKARVKRIEKQLNVD